MQLTAYGVTTVLFLAGALTALAIGVHEAWRADNWSDVIHAAALIAFALYFSYQLA